MKIQNILNFPSSSVLTLSHLSKIVYNYVLMMEMVITDSFCWQEGTMQNKTFFDKKAN